MRVAICVDAFPKLSETFVLDHVKVLRAAGHTVAILAAGRSRQRVVHPDAAALEPFVQHLPIPSAARRLAQAVARTRPIAGEADIIHCHFGPVGRSRLYLKRRLRVPLVVSFHGYDLVQYPRQHGTGVYRALFREADRIVVNTAFARQLVQRLGCPPGKIVHLPLGIDVGGFPFRTRTPPAGAPVVITVARLVEKKGIHVALPAIAEVRRAYPQLQYHVVGDGPLRGRLEAQRRSLGLDGTVTFWGARDRTDLLRHLDAAHVFVLPSIVADDGDVETQGLVVQEAQACGLPVIVTGVGGLPEGLDVDRSGYVVPPGDPGALAARLTFLLDHPELWPVIGARGRQWVEERFSLERFGRGLLEMYDRLLASGGA